MKRFQREFTIRWDCSVRPICRYVCRVIIGFKQKLSKKAYVNSISKITRPAGHFWICQVPNLQCKLHDEQYPLMELRFKIKKYLFVKMEHT